MATFSELCTVACDQTLLDRLAVAAAVVAQTINDEDPSTPYHERRKRWARETFRSPPEAARQAVWAFIAQHKDATPDQILGCTDEQLQVAVAKTLNTFVEL